MESVITSYSKPDRAPAWLPWVPILFLTGIFFMTNHNLFFPIHYRERLMLESSQIAREILEGSLRRRLSFLLLALFGAAHFFLRGKNRLNINGSLGGLVLCYLAWAFLSILWTDNHLLTFRRVLVFGAFSLTAISMAKRYPLNYLILFAFCSSLMLLLTGLCTEIYLHTFKPFDAAYRFAGTCHPNNQGLNCGLLFLSAISLGEASKNRRFYLGAAVIAFIFLVLTKSRASLIGTLFALGAYWSFKSSLPKKGVVVLISSWLLSLLLLIFGKGLLSRIWETILLGRGGLQTYTLSGRIPLWLDLLEHAKQSPLFGYGYHSFWDPPRHIQLFNNIGWVPYHAHSEYLELLLDLGVVGLLLFVSIMALGTRRSLNYYRRSGISGYGFCFSLLLFCLIRGVLEPTIAEPKLFTFLIMWGTAYLAFVKNQPEAATSLKEEYHEAIDQRESLHIQQAFHAQKHP